MLRIDEIRQIHLEPSSFCNARCPRCPRNDNGAEVVNDFVERNLTLAEIQQIFPESVIRNLRSILYNGNFGDMIMNPEIEEITQWFRSLNSRMQICANTNGGARGRDFWINMAKLRVDIMFGLDGLADTHHLYRQNTVFDVAMKNAQTFIDAGGNAVWKMIRFQHNEHQIDACRKLAEKMGFKEFQLLNHNRGGSHAYDRYGNYSHTIEGFDGPRDFETMRQDRARHESKVFEIVLDENPPHEIIQCMSKKYREIYVTSAGEIYPCCFLGHSPATLDALRVRMPGLPQVKKLMSAPIKVNALEHGLEACLEWFALVEETWNLASFKEGRLLICDETCGKNPSRTGGEVMGEQIFWETTDRFKLKEIS